MEDLFDGDKPQFATWLWIYTSMSTMCPERPEVVPLYYAAQYGFRDLTKHLLAKHPEDIHSKGGGEVTPLHAAAAFGHTEVFSLLIEHFPDVNIPGPHHQTPLHRASYSAPVEISLLSTRS